MEGFENGIAAVVGQTCTAWPGIGYSTVSKEAWSLHMENK